MMIELHQVGEEDKMWEHVIIKKVVKTYTL